MEQADRHPEEDLVSLQRAEVTGVFNGSPTLQKAYQDFQQRLERERDKLRDELTQAMWNKAVELQRKRNKLRDELTQARQDAERDRNALEATYKRQQELEKERDQAHEATDRRMQMLEEVDRERRRRKESCLWCNGVAAHDSSCAYLKEKRAYDSPKACPPELRDAENKAPYCPACGAATPDGGPCLRCAEYAIDAVRAPSDVPKMPSLPTAYEDREYYWTCLDIAVRWLLAEHDEKQRILRRAERENP